MNSSSKIGIKVTVLIKCAGIWGKRQAAALIIVTVVALVGFTLPRLIRMAMPAQKEEMVEVTRLSTLEEPEIKEETMKKVEPIAPPPPALKSTIKFTAPVIRKDEEVNEDDELKSQDETDAN